MATHTPDDNEDVAQNDPCGRPLEAAPRHVQLQLACAPESAFGTARVRAMYAYQLCRAQGAAGGP
jgi:hypothetical protein